MVSDGNGNFVYTVPEGSGIAEYKFTRGSWNTVEGNATGNYLPNRTFTFSGTAQTLNLTIQSWEDLGAGNASTAASNAVSYTHLDVYKRQKHKTILKF